jgi:CheY-like chemotaxis protein/two-component sensor histidine kinase
MSHELRTPLNSLLILARNLSENGLENLTPDQIESSKIIYNSGNDLLELINDILDLSKIESGKMSLNLDKFRLQDFERNVLSTFNHMIAEKGLKLEIILDENLPEYILSDYQKVTQVIKNLMSNAIKFTQAGTITFRIYQETDHELFNLNSLKIAKKVIAFSVKDTGIGIKEDKQIAVFEAFQQADGSTSRRFGGTGLGLSISRQLVLLLGGEIKLKSEFGKGSEFTFYIPTKIYQKTQNVSIIESEKEEMKSDEIEEIKAKQKALEAFLNSKNTIKTFLANSFDDRMKISKNEKIILAIEPDITFSKTLHKMCNDKGFKFLSATTGEEGIEMAERFLPTAIILDLKLSGISGYEVLEILKEKKFTRHIPIHIISNDEHQTEVLKRGAIGFISKPIDSEKLEEAFATLEDVINKKIKDLLIVEDNSDLRKSIVKLIKSSDVNCTEASSGSEAIELIRQTRFDCMVLDLGLPDMQGTELLNTLANQLDVKIPPVIVYTGKELSQEEHAQLKKYSDSIIIKGVKSEERLLDETALFLHRVIDDLPDHMQKIITNIHTSKDDIFKDKKILIVDDDMRNVFALSKILNEKGLKIIKAEDGKKALQLLQENPDTKLILMDIMMPVMDGYTAIREIRKIKEYIKLPIIALTAKAMKEDRDKCMEAGATDYLSKPVDIERLISLIRVWLYN